MTAPVNLYANRQFVDQHALPVSTGIADDDLRQSFNLVDAGDRGIHLARHPLARTLILESIGTELRRLDDAGDAFHVDGDEDLSGPLRAGRGAKKQEEKGDVQMAHEPPF